MFLICSYTGFSPTSILVLVMSAVQENFWKFHLKIFLQTVWRKMHDEHRMRQLRRSKIQTAYTLMKTSVLISEEHRCTAEFLSQVPECVKHPSWDPTRGRILVYLDFVLTKYRPSYDFNTPIFICCYNPPFSCITKLGLLLSHRRSLIWTLYHHYIPHLWIWQRKHPSFHPT